MGWQVIIGNGLERYDVDVDVWWCAVWCRPFENSVDSVQALHVCFLLAAGNSLQRSSLSMAPESICVEHI